ncbi:CAAX protease [Bacillus cereus]|nr:CAAX protease [Bacillus cereus]PGU62156.1 CAAX protease [Bacillus cereus]
MPTILRDTSQGIGEWVGAGHLLYAIIYTRKNNLLLLIFIHAF